MTESSGFTIRSLVSFFLRFGYRPTFGILVVSFLDPSAFYYIGGRCSDNLSVVPGCYEDEDCNGQDDGRRHDDTPRWF